MMPDWAGSAKVRPISEKDIDRVIKKAGGMRAYPDDNAADRPNADYILGNGIIELKILEGEGLDYETRQAKIAKLFKDRFPNLPTVVIHREGLSEKGQSEFDNILASGMKRQFSKAVKQLKRTREDHPSATCSVLLVVNNGYTTLGHDELASVILKRIRNDTSAIDAVVVAGAYFHGDGFDTVALWPIECFPVHDAATFDSFDALKDAWDSMAEEFMTAMMRGEPEYEGNRGLIADNVFIRDGVRFVRPAPSFGSPSEFYIHGRPRMNSTGIDQCPPVAKSFPLLGRRQWEELTDLVFDSWRLGASFERYLELKAEAISEEEATLPLVPIPIGTKDWRSWCGQSGQELSAMSVFEFANVRFCARLNELLEGALHFDELRIIPSAYAIAITDVIGQDKANDVSHIALVREHPTGGEPFTRYVLKEQAMFHEHALALCGAYAIREGYSTIVWSKNERYAWV